MWIKDNYGRLINSDNVVHFDVVNANKGKENTNPSWVVAARILKTDWSTGTILYLTEKLQDKDEVQMRLDAIEDALCDSELFLLELE